MADKPEIYQHYDQVPWGNWVPQERATLLFIVEQQHVLLIHKKRGLGSGKVTGPGGRLEPGESERTCALRELHEELGVTTRDPQVGGVLLFQFCKGLALHVTVFRASECQGEPQESEEAIPLWAPIEAIPYDRMWEDGLFMDAVDVGRNPFLRTLPLSWRQDGRP